MKKFAKGIAVVTGVVGVAAVAVGVYEKLTGKNVVDEAKKFLSDLDSDDDVFNYESDEDDDYDEDDFGSWDSSDDEEDGEDDSEFEPDDEDDSEEK